jgi:hypothetical protein
MLTFRSKKTALFRSLIKFYQFFILQPQNSPNSLCIATYRHTLMFRQVFTVCLPYFHYWISSVMLPRLSTSSKFNYRAQGRAESWAFLVLNSFHFTFCVLCFGGFCCTVFSCHQLSKWKSFWSRISTKSRSGATSSGVF